MKPAVNMNDFRCCVGCSSLVCYTQAFPEGIADGRLQPAHYVTTMGCIVVEDENTDEDEVEAIMKEFRKGGNACPRYSPFDNDDEDDTVDDNGTQVFREIGIAVNYEEGRDEEEEEDEG